MKYKVIEGFRDKNTLVRYKPGDIIEISKERADEILSKGKLISKMKTTTKRVVE